MSTIPDQVVFKGFRHESVCAKVLFQEPGAACSCSSPFPIPELPEDTTLSDAEFEQVERDIVLLGHLDGMNQAEWAFDGNTSESALRAMRQAIDDGDPDMPAPRSIHSGEWGDDPQWEETVADCLPEGKETTPEEDDDLFSLYQDAVNEAFYSRLAERLAYMLDNSTKGGN
jgi:hypothetical protein